MHVRDARDDDLVWLPEYILGGFDNTGYTPCADRIRASIALCRGEKGFALIAERDNAPAGILGAIVADPWWTAQAQITVLALRATQVGAGALLMRTLLARARATFASHVGVTIENPDPRVDSMMRRLGKFRLLRTYVFENKE